MATTPEPSRDTIIMDFRAPPPSPIAAGRKPTVTNDEVLTEFLETSLRVPNLILPDRVFPKQKSVQNPPKLDLQRLTRAQSDHGGDEQVTKILDSIAQIGCFQVVNHGVPHDLIESVLAAGAGIFRIPPEKRKSVTKTAERAFGFEESSHGENDDDDEGSEEFVWCFDERLMANLEGIWPNGYSNFRENMEKLSSNIEMAAEKVMHFLIRNSSQRTHPVLDGEAEDVGSHQTGPVCYLQKHSQSTHQNINGDQEETSLRHDVIRTLIRGSEFSHSLSVHICTRCEEFHVYSKKGWASFRPENHSLVITIGDQLQAWSSGQYKQVIGRPVYEQGMEEDSISLAMLYSPPTQGILNKEENKFGEKYVSLGQQFLILVLVSLVYRFWTCV